MRAVSVKTITPVTAPASGGTPALLTPTTGNWDFISIPNRSASNLYIRAQNASETAPTSSTLTSATGWTYLVTPLTTLTLNFGPNIALYMVLAAGTADIEATTGVYDS